MINRTVTEEIGRRERKRTLESSEEKAMNILMGQDMAALQV